MQLTCLLLCSIARAHGVPPQIYGVAAVVNGTPQLVILNEGLALRGERGWSYLCPALWGDTDAIAGGSTKAQSLDGKTTFIIGDDVYAFDGRSFAPQGHPLLREFETTVLTGNATALFALHFGATGHAIVPVGSAVNPPLWAPSSYWSTLAVDAQRLYVARAEQGKRLDLTILDAAGVEQHSEQIALDIEPMRLRLAALPQGLFAIAQDPTSSVLGKLDVGRFQRLATATRSLLGPVAAPNGSLWIAIDGRLQPLPAEGQAAVPGSDVNCLDLTNRPAAECVTCLGQLQGLAYACSAVDLYRLGDDGLGEPLFDLRGLRAPPPELVSDPVTERCESQWRVYEYDLRSNNLAPRGLDAPPVAGADASQGGAGTAGAAGSSGIDPVGHAPPAGGSCAAGMGVAPSPRWPLWLLVLGSALWVRRRWCA